MKMYRYTRRYIVKEAGGEDREATDVFVSPHPIEKQHPSMLNNKNVEIEEFEISDDALAFLVYVEYSDYDGSITEHLGLFSDLDKAEAFFNKLDKDTIPKMYGYDNATKQAYLVGFVLNKTDKEIGFTFETKEIS